MTNQNAASSEYVAIHHATRTYLATRCKIVPMPTLTYFLNTAYHNLPPTQTTRAIGLMSGTSLDGVDVAWLETDGHTIQKFGPAATLHYEDTLRTDLRRLLDLAPTISPDDPFLKDVEKRLTQDHAIAVGLVGLSADVIGFHGQTILHAPDRHRTWQIGDAAL